VGFTSGNIESHQGIGEDGYDLIRAVRGTGNLPATGQTGCYGLVENQGWVEVPCVGAEIPGQDGAYRVGCPVEGRFVDNGDGTVTDTCTGFMWQKDTADVNGDGSIGMEPWPGDLLLWEDALRYCEDLDFAGHTDWRLPNVRELQSIVDYGRVNPSVDPVFGALSDRYWSSSFGINLPDHPWFIDFDFGDVIHYNDIDYGNRHFVRAVRNAR